MKRTLILTLTALGSFLLSGTLQAQTSAFTYQGRLTANGAPASGLYDLRFTIFDSSGGPTVVGGPLTNSATVVSDGLFTVILDLGAGVFDGGDRWLEIGAVTNGGGDFTTLVPRQAITATPYAVRAANAATAASVTGSIADSQLSTNIARLNGTNDFTGTNRFNGIVLAKNSKNQIAGDGSGLTNLNPTNLVPGTAAINISGNAATATTATTANNFSGSLAGDVTGSQSATIVATVGGQSAANVANGASAANAATNANTPNTIVKRDASGNFAAGLITANLAGNATTATTASNFLGNIADSQLSANIPRLNGTNVFTGTNRFAGVVVATNGNNLLTGTFTGNGSGLTSLNPTNLSVGTAAISISGNAVTATTAANFTGAIADSQLSANVARLNGTNIFTGTNRFAGVVVATNGNNLLTGAFTGNGSGLTSLNPTNLSAGTAGINISGVAASATTAGSFTGVLAGDVTGTQGATAVTSVGGQSSANVASGVGAANAATSTNTPNTIVKRDASGNFAAGLITANLAGNATTATTASNFLGNIADSQLSTNIARLNGTNIFTGTNRFVGVLIATNANNQLGPIAASQLTGFISSNNIAAGSITAPMLAAGSVTAAALAANAVRASNIVDGSITGDDIADLTITAKNFAPGALGKPYQSGRIVAENLTNRPFTTQYPLLTVPLSSAFTAPPVVTLTYVDPSPGNQVLLKSTTSNNFTTLFTTDPPGFDSVTVETGAAPWAGSLDTMAFSNRIGVAYVTIANKSAPPATNVWFSSSTDGTNWSTTSVVTNTRAITLSLALVANQPAIAYFDLGFGQVRYVRALDGLGSSWGTPTTLSVSNRNFTMEVINGQPAIACSDRPTNGPVTTSTNLYVGFLRANDSVGSSWPATPVIVWSQGFFYPTNAPWSKPSLVQVSGSPALCFSSIGGIHWYVRATDAAGSTWPAPVQMTTPYCYPDDKMQIIDGFPTIVYLDNIGSLIYRRANDALGTTWGSGGPLVSGGSIQDFKLYQNRPIVLGGPGVIQAVDPDGAAWYSGASTPTPLYDNPTVSATEAFGKFFIGAVINPNGPAGGTLVVGPLTPPSFTINWIAIQP